MQASDRALSGCRGPDALDLREGELDPLSREPVEHDAQALLAAMGRLIRMGEECLIPGVHVVAQDMDVGHVGAYAELDRRDDVDPAIHSGPDSLLYAVDGIVVRERDHIQASPRGAGDDVARTEGPVRRIRVDVEVELHGPPQGGGNPRALGAPYASEISSAKSVACPGEKSSGTVAAAYSDRTITRWLSTLTTPCRTKSLPGVPPMSR